MIDRYGTFGRATSPRQVMNRLLEDAFVTPHDGGASLAGSVPMNVYEEGDDLFIEASLPGIKQDELDVRVEQGVLTISGRGESEQEHTDRHYLFREWFPGRFSRSVRLPSTYRPEECQASFEDGVLRLTFPKAEEAKPRRIQIGTGKRSTTAGQPPETPRPQAAGGVPLKPEDRA